MKTRELIVLGAGPAGITAAIYAARKRIDCLVLTGDIGGQTAWSGEVENYTGNQLISGPALALQFEDHLRQYPLEVHEGERAVRLARQDGLLVVATAKEAYRARAVIIATGKRTKELGVPGEQEYRNKGVTYCAICDGPLFAGRDVAVVGGGNSALDAVLQLVTLANRVYIVDIAAALSGDAVLQEKVRQSEKVELLQSTRVNAINGEMMVTGLSVTTPGGPRELAVQGVFVEIGLVPNAAFAEGVATNGLGEIIVDHDCTTSVPGVFAAGDVTNVHDKQIIIAAGEGAKASLAAHRYLMTKER